MDSLGQPLSSIERKGIDRTISKYVDPLTMMNKHQLDLSMDGCD